MSFAWPGGSTRLNGRVQTNPRAQMTALNALDGAPMCAATSRRGALGPSEQHWPAAASVQRGCSAATFLLYTSLTSIHTMPLGTMHPSEMLCALFDAQARLDPRLAADGFHSRIVGSTPIRAILSTWRQRFQTCGEAVCAICLVSSDICTQRGPHYRQQQRQKRRYSR